MSMHILLIALSPLITLISVICFFIVWFKDKDSQLDYTFIRSLLIVSAGGILVSYFLPSMPFYVNAFGIGCVGYFGLKYSNYLKQKSKSNQSDMPFKILIIAAMLIVSWSDIQFETYNMEIVSSLLMIVIYKAAILFLNRKASAQSRNSKVLCGALFFTTPLFVICSIYVYSLDITLTQENYYSSSAWHAVIISTVLTALIINMSLFSHLILELFDNFKQRHETDSLSGLLMRGPFEKKVEIILSDSSATIDTGTYLMMIDIDHFKTINDKYGHTVGDLVIKAVGANIANSVRKSDVVGRVGGEEFCVCLEDISYDNAIKIAEKIHNNIKNLNTKPFADGLWCTASIGGARLKADESISDLYKRADQMLYHVKQNGRNQIKFDGVPERHETPAGIVLPAAMPN